MAEYAMRYDVIKEQGLVVLDIEGSGGRVRGDPYGTGSIVSLGAVDFGTGDELYEECRVMEGRGYDDQALRVNGFTREQIYDRSKQSVLELLVKFEDFCKSHNSNVIAAWGDYDLKMLLAAYSYYGREWALPGDYINLKSISRSVPGHKKSGLSNTAMKLGIPSEQHPHIAINGARLAVENTSILLFRKHYYSKYEEYKIPDFEQRERKPQANGYQIRTRLKST